MPSKRLKTKAIVLGEKPFREHSKFFLLFTEDLGFVHAAAYGASRFGSARSGHLDIGNFCEIELAKRPLWTIESCRSINCFPKTRGNFEASYLLLHSLSFLKDHLPAEMPMPELFEFTLKFLTLLNTSLKITSPLGLFVFFQWKTLTLLGMLPRFSEKTKNSPAENLFRLFEKKSAEEIFGLQDFENAKGAMALLEDFKK